MPDDEDIPADMPALLPDDVAAVVAGWPAAMSTLQIRPDHCIVAAAILRDLFADRAAVRVTSVLYSNRLAQGFLGHLQGRRIADMHPDARTVGVLSGIGKQTPGDGYDGHLVVIIDRRWLVDLSAPQFHHPEWGIQVRQPVVIDLLAPAQQSAMWGLLGKQWDLKQLGVGIGWAHYTLLSDVIADWHHAPDWRFVTHRQVVLDQLIADGVIPAGTVATND